MSGISDKALKTPYAENKFKFDGGVEMQNKEFSDGTGLELYETTFRGYDPQIGRFWQLDPLADLSEGFSPYSFANNNPILFNDPFGLLSDSLHPQELQPVVVTPGRPAPHVDVHVGRADVGAEGGDPAESTVPPLTVSPLRNTKFEFEKQFVPSSIAYKLGHTVVEKSSWWDRFWDNVGYEGKNIYGERVEKIYHGGVADPLGASGEPIGGIEGLFKLRGSREWEELFEWGHNTDIITKLATTSARDVERLKSAGVTVEQLREWAKFYGAAIGKKAGRSNLTAKYRLDFINKLISLW